MLLVGIGGTGKTTMIKICAFIINIEIYEIELTKSYKGITIILENNWKDDMRKIIKLTGGKGS